MKSRLFSALVRGLMAAAFVSVASAALAQNIDDQIKDLEKEVSRIRPLEQQLERLKEQQIALKREATAAEAALPTFSYRPGNGLTIEAADKAWSFRAGIEAHFRMLFESGRDQAGRTNGEVFARRFRPNFYYCINNCLYEIEVIFDLDGFGTGNAKNSTNTSTSSILHRGALNVHLENLNPWLPTVQLGMDVSASIGTSRQGSSSVGAQAEYDLLSRNNGFDDGRSGNGILLNWDNRPLDSIGIPGRINRFQVGMASVGEGDDGLSSVTDRKDFIAYLGVEPFSQLKNKWLSGLKGEMGAWFCNNDNRGAVTSGSTTAVVGNALVTGSNIRSFGADNACGRLRIQDLGNGGRQALFDSNAGIGDGLAPFLMPGLTWEVGPYALRLAGGFQRYEDRGGTTGRKTGNMFLIGHDLFLWSPKGFLTGSAATPGSILIGTHFERTDVACMDAARCSGINGGEFHRDRILLREWDLFYFLAPRMSIGANILWYDASNLRTGRGNAGENLGVFPVGCPVASCSGKGGDWTDIFLNYRYQF